MGLLKPLELLDEVRALTAQARLSAGVLVALPVVGTVGFSFLDPAVGRVLLLTPSGWACLVVGGALEASFALVELGRRVSFALLARLDVDALLGANDTDMASASSAAANGG